MTRNELIAAVAVDLIKTHQKEAEESGGSLRLCMVGLEPSVVCSIARCVSEDPDTTSTISVKVAHSFDTNNELPGDLKSEESITHWRHCRLPQGTRGVLFAASQLELQRNDKSVEKITKIETDTLRTRFEAWIRLAGLTATAIDDSTRTFLNAALDAADYTHTARTIEIFADFVLDVSERVLAGETAPRAVDQALPCVKLPRGSGDFERIPKMKLGNPADWNKIYRRLNRRIRPLLVRENDRGDPIPRDQLRKNFDDIREGLDSEECSVIERFLSADLSPDGWSEPQRELVELEWTRISGLFEGVATRTATTLGQRTIAFFESEHSDVLNDNDVELLNGTFPRDPSDELREFFDSYREHLAKNKRLTASWERYIFRNPQTYEDFIVGLLATLDALRQRSDERKLVKRKLSVHVRNSEEDSFWKSKNARAMRYFAFRYRGLDALLGDNVLLDFGKLQEKYYPVTNEYLVNCNSRSRDARSLKFEVALDPDGANEKMIFHWEISVDAIATALPDDLWYIANVNEPKALLSTSEISRQPVSAKGGIQRISLNDVNTIRDVLNTNRGQLVSPNLDLGDRSTAIAAMLIDPVIGLSADDTIKVRECLDTFHDSYTNAVRDWAIDGVGIASEAIIQQATSFGDLLDVLLRSANNDRARDGLWLEILRIGVANVVAGSSAAVVAPWHPLRLLEIGVKARQASALINTVLQADADDIYRADLLFGQVQYELALNYYPEVCVSIDNDAPTLLVATDTRLDYTLAEPPLRDKAFNGDDTLDVDPSMAARAFASVGEQYLKLLPHERSNFSVVLYNAESKALPSALASELSRKVEQESELQCDLLLTHSDPKSIRRIYEQQNVSATENSGSVMASEAARNFLSRLRVGLLDASDLDQESNERPTDLVALQDVFARNANLAWKKVGNESPADVIQHVPARWSRRRPVKATDTGNAVYLACPVQTAAGQSYLNALDGVINGDNALGEDAVPAREVNFRDVKEEFESTHRMGEWVVNFDQLVDRRMLVNNQVRVIRHIHDRFVDRNIIVSTTSKLRLLRVLIEDRLRRMDPALSSYGAETVNCLIDQANVLSGQVVMRAARYGRYANELIGIVLSMEKILSGLDNEGLPVGWYFLDDCASWFGQKEEQIADIMAIAPRVEGGSPILKIAISEAKFVSSVGYRSHVKKSAKQLQETVARIGRALDPQHNRIDREIWLHRLGNFMIEGIEPFGSEQVNGWDLHRWSREVRDDQVAIQLVGFSHVFVHDDLETVESGEPIPLQATQHCTQQIIDKKGTVELIRSLTAGNASAQGQDNLNAERWPQPLSSDTETEVEGSDAETGSVFKEQASSSDVATIESEDFPNDAQPPAAAQFDRLVSDRENVRPNAPPVELDASSLHEGQFDKQVLQDSRWRSRELQDWADAERPYDDDDNDAEIWLEATVRALQRALRGYDMTAEVIGSRLTPNAALVRFRGSDNLTVTRVEKRQQELLTSHAIRVINVLPAPREVVILVARPKRAILSLRDLWRHREFPVGAPETNTSLLLGARESDGELLYLNVGNEFGGLQAHGPHTLIAGETGSGKGVLVQCLLLDICATNAPSSARIQMIDPKAGSTSRGYEKCLTLTAISSLNVMMQLWRWKGLLLKWSVEIDCWPMRASRSCRATTEKSVLMSACLGCGCFTMNWPTG